MSDLGHSLQGRPSGKSRHVRCDAESGSQFRTLATLRAATPLYGRPFKCKACGSREVTLFTVDSQAELDEVLQSLPPPPSAPAPTTHPRPDPDKGLCCRPHGRGNVRAQRRGSTFRPGSSPPLRSTFSLLACSARRRVLSDGRPMAPHCWQR
jgi:hypothetical protein